jgi:hypothetical protein
VSPSVVATGSPQPSRNCIGYVPIRHRVGPVSLHRLQGDDSALYRDGMSSTYPAIRGASRTRRWIWPTSNGCL